MYSICQEHLIQKSCTINVPYLLVLSQLVLSNSSQPHRPTAHLIFVTGKTYVFPVLQLSSFPVHNLTNVYIFDYVLEGLTADEPHAQWVILCVNKDFIIIIITTDTRQVANIRLLVVPGMTGMMLGTYCSVSRHLELFKHLHRPSPDLICLKSIVNHHPPGSL